MMTRCNLKYFKTVKDILFMTRISGPSQIILILHDSIGELADILKLITGWFI